MDSRDLYQQLILDHNKSPRNFGELEAPTHSAEGFNPLCGDHYWFYVELDSSNLVIKKLSFKGDGCAISKAVSSILSQSVIGKNVLEVKELFSCFREMLLGQNLAEKLMEEQKKTLGKLFVFEGIRKYPSRMKCAMLPWHTVIAAIENKKLAESESVY